MPASKRKRPAAASASASKSKPAADIAPHRVIELRQYALRPGRFDPFVQLFEREFIEPQEAAGMRVIGQFRDLDAADRFVWLRGFADTAARAHSLEAFYGGALWQSLRAEANANFVDTDDVLLLRPVSAGRDVDLRGAIRADVAAGVVEPPGVVLLAVHPVDAGDAPEYRRWFARDVEPAMAQAGIALTAWLETDPTPNNFPRLPVRESEYVFVWIARHADRHGADKALHDLTASALWRDTLGPGLCRRLSGPPQLLRLEPTGRSLLRGA
jgi:NIPSNAP